MKKIYFLLILLIGIGLNSSKAQDQTPQHIYMPWTMLLETDSHIEVFATVVKCTSTSKPQIHLMVFNEGAEPKNLTVKINVQNTADATSVQTSYQIAANAATIYQASCSVQGTAADQLKFDVPAAFNPDKIKITATIQ